MCGRVGLSRPPNLLFFPSLSLSLSVTDRRKLRLSWPLACLLPITLVPLRALSRLVLSSSYVRTCISLFCFVFGWVRSWDLPTTFSLRICLPLYSLRAYFSSGSSYPLYRFSFLFTCPYSLHRRFRPPSRSSSWTRLDDVSPFYDWTPRRPRRRFLRSNTTKINNRRLLVLTHNMSQPRASPYMA